MKAIKNILLLLLITSTISAFSSDEVLVETNNFSVKTSKQFARQNNPRFCRFKTEINIDTRQIKIRVGVVGSPVDYFGWNMPIDLQDLPLTEGYSRKYKSPGVTGMIMTYTNGTLTFKKMKSEKAWNRLYPFSLKIDSNLKSPKSFKGSLEGYERTIFGRLKKHVVAKCNF